MRGLIEFDLSSLPSGITITKARLGLNALVRYGVPGPFTLSAYRLNRQWIEDQVTWNRATSLSGGFWEVPGAGGVPDDRLGSAAGTTIIGDALPQWYEIDLTSLVQDWVNGIPNHGVLLVGSGPTTDVRLYTSEEPNTNLRPYLDIWYYVGAPTSTPTATATGGTPTTSTPTPTATIPPSTIVLQDGVDGYAGTRDVYIDEYAVDTNYNGVFDASELKMKPGSPKLRSLVAFDFIGYVPDYAIIDSATLELSANYYASVPDRALTVSAYRLKRGWVEDEATWNSAAVGAQWGVPGADSSTDRDLTPAASMVVSETNRKYTMDITTLAQYWVDHPDENHGVLLIATGLTTERRFWASEYQGESNRPLLRISWHPRPPTATPTFTPTNTPTNTPTPTPTNTPTNTPTATNTSTPTNTPTPSNTPTATPSTGRIHGIVWDDVTPDGSQTGGEPPLPGIQVRLLDLADNPLRVAFTDSQGAYDFPSLVPGWYRAQVVVPVGYYATTETSWDLQVLAGWTIPINFGLRQSGTHTPTATPRPPRRAFLPIIVKNMSK